MRRSTPAIATARAWMGKCQLNRWGLVRPPAAITKMVTEGDWVYGDVLDCAREFPYPAHDIVSAFPVKPKQEPKS